MPIYEFYSPDTHKIYSFYARSLAYANQTPRCPDGAQYRMQKLISAFAVLGARKKAEPENGPEGPANDAADPRMEAAMAAMEREFAGMDTDNPDPRQLGRMMRRMSELSGEKMPLEMEEMTRRLEAGEDPDKLEEQFGDQFGEEPSDESAAPGEPPTAANETPAQQQSRRQKWLRRLARQRRQAEPLRDPTLYEIAEYVAGQ